MSFIFKKFNLGDIVIISHKDSPGMYQPARIYRVWTHQHQADRVDPGPIQYSYDVTTLNYKNDPFKPFHGSTSSYMSWSELHYFETPESFKEWMDFLLKDVITISVN